MNLPVDDVISVEVFGALEKRGECIDEFIFGKEFPVEGSFAVL
jgi:hypothetical protein